MFHDDDSLYPYYPGSHFDVDRPSLARLTHLVLVDGRLVDTWSEPVEGTRWEHHAHRFDRELRKLDEPEPERKPPYQQVLEWLDGVCGGREALEALDDAPLRSDDRVLPDVADGPSTPLLAEAAGLLGVVAARHFDPETAIALHRALLRVWTDQPETVTRARTTRHLAGGLCWVVGKANGLFRPAGETRMSEVQDALALSSAISSYAPSVQSALRGLREFPTDRWGRPNRPDGTPHLLALGHPDLLVSATRERLIRLRDRALAARDAATAA